MEEKRTIGPVTGFATLGASLGVVLNYLATLAGLDVPEPVQLAIVALLTAVAGWLVKPGTGKRRS